MGIFYIIEIEYNKKVLQVVNIRKSTYKQMKKQNVNIFKDYIRALYCLYE